MVDLAEEFAEIDVAGIAERLTGSSAWLHDLDELFDPLHLPYRQAEDTKQAIWQRLRIIVRTAFVAGVIAGSDPQAMLLARLSSTADRLETAAGKLEGGESYANGG